MINMSYADRLLQFLQLRWCGDKIGEDAKSMLSKSLGLTSAILSLVIATLSLIFLYIDLPNQEYDGTAYYALSALGARNIIFVCAIIFAVTGVTSASVYVLGDNTYGANLYKSAIQAYQHNYLHTTISFVLLSLFFLYAGLPEDIADGNKFDKATYGWAPLISWICAVVLKIMIEIAHSRYVQQEALAASDTKEFYTQSRLMGILTMSGVLVFTLVNFATDWGDFDWSSTGSGLVVLFEIIYIGLQVLESSATPEESSKGLFGVGLSLAQISITVSYLFLGWFLATNKNISALFVCLMFVYLDGLQLGMLQKGEVRLERGTLPKLYRLLQVGLGLFAFIALVQNANGKLSTSEVIAMNSTEIKDSTGHVEALTYVMYSVALAASIVKFVGGVFSLKDPIRSPSPEQVFRKFSSTALLISSTYLWIGGIDFHTALPEEYKLSTGVSISIFVVALINRILDSFIDSSMDNDNMSTSKWDEVWAFVSLRDDDKKGLNKTTIDNVRLWMVYGALLASLGMLARYGNKNWSKIYQKDNIVDRNYVASLVLIGAHILLVTVCILGTVFEPLKRVALSKSSAARLTVSTAVICCLVVLAGQSAAIVDQKHLKAPNSVENNIIGALVAYLFADALGAEFL